MSGRSWNRWPVAVTVFATAWLSACSGGPPGGGFGGGARQQAVTVVEVAPVERGAVSDTLLTHAIVESESQVDLYAVASGIVLEVRAEEGDVVRKGDVLAVVDSVSLGAGAERASAEVAKLARELDDVRRLHGQGAVSDKDLSDAEYALSTARTSSREASHSYGQSRITAPFDGVVAARDVRVGELASSAQRAFQVVDLDSLRVVASLPERDVARVRVGQSVRLVSAYDEDQTATGTVVRIAPVIDASSGTFRVTVGMDPSQRSLRPGQFVAVAVEVDRHEDVIVVPREALVYEEGDPVVYAMIPEPEEDEEAGDGAAEAAGGAMEQLQQMMASWFAKDGEQEQEEAVVEPYVARRSPLEIGLIDDDAVEVTSGVELGEQVIVVGQSNLRDASPVRTPEMVEAASAAAAAAEAATEESEG
jgi:membrane fusion protein (multidrug efflux system)